MVRASSCLLFCATLKTLDRYDRHREAILRAANKVQVVADSLSDDDLLLLCTSSCFRSLDDSPTGFYTVYGEAFAKLNTDEKRHASGADDVDLPVFGTSESDYDEVVRIFYDSWSCFSTRK